MGYLNKLFRRKESVPPDQASTAPLDPSSLAEFVVDDIKPHLTLGSSQSTGVGHGKNFDSLLVLNGTAESSDGLPDFALLCVADGSEETEDGSRASAISVRSLASSLTQGAILDLLAPDPVRHSESLDEMVKLAIERSNKVVRANAEGGTTTLTAAFIVGNEAVIGHVGDTRAYLIEGDGIQSLTSDHTIVQQLLDTGTISEEEASVHPQRDVLWNEVGKAIDVRPDVDTHVCPPGSYLLICTDGLWEVVSDDGLLETVNEVEVPQLIAEALVDEAKKAGSEDDITVLVAYFPSPPEESF